MKVLLRTRRVLPFIIVVLVGMLGLAAERLLVTHAAAFTVTNCGDALPTPPTGSLRAAINAASPGDIITFSLSCNIMLAGPLSISKSLTVDGSGQSITLNGQGAVRVFQVVNTGITFTLNALAIANGSAPGDSGGGLFNISGSTVNITNSTFTNNSALVGGGLGNGNLSTTGGTVNITNSIFSNNSAPGGSGGGIFNNGGTVNITNSTLDHNHAGGFGGGLFTEAGGTVTITNSTFSNNSAGLDGGGINNPNSTMNITNSTFANNSATASGGAILNNTATTHISNSTIANNSASSGGGISTNTPVPIVTQSIVANNSGGNCNSPVNDQGYNLSNDTSCGFTDPTSRQNINPGLDPAGLANNGGPTQTIALEPSSPAIDIIPAPSVCKLTSDQRGFPRPDNGESVCDIGAYEFQDPAPSAPPSLLCQLHLGPVQAQVTGGQASGQADSSASSTTSTDENNGGSTNSNDATTGSTTSATGGNAQVATGPIGISC